MKKLIIIFMLLIPLASAYMTSNTTTPIQMNIYNVTPTYTEPFNSYYYISNYIPLFGTAINGTMNITAFRDLNHSFYDVDKGTSWGIMDATHWASLGYDENFDTYSQNHLSLNDNTNTSVWFNALPQDIVGKEFTLKVWADSSRENCYITIACQNTTDRTIWYDVENYTGTSGSDPENYTIDLRPECIYQNVVNVSVRMYSDGVCAPRFYDSFLSVYTYPQDLEYFMGYYFSPKWDIFEKDIFDYTNSSVNMSLNNALQNIWDDRDNTVGYETYWFYGYTGTSRGYIVMNEIDVYYYLTNTSYDTNYIETERVTISTYFGVYNINITTLDLNLTFNSIVYPTVRQTPYNLYSSNFIIPLITTDQNSTIVDFYYNYSYSLLNGTYINGVTDTLNAQVDRLVLFQCNGENESLNWTFKDESTTTKIITDVGLTLSAFIDSQEDARNFSFSFSGGDSYAVCMLPMYRSFLIDGTMEYNAPTYVNRNYYYDNFTLLNTTQYEILYLLEDTNASLIKMYLVDENDDPIEGAFIKTFKYYPSTNEYNLVEKSVTDFAGITSQYLTAYDVEYRFIIEFQGKTILTTNTATITNSVLFFTAFLEENFVREYSEIRNVQSNLVYDNVTRRFTFTYSDDNNEISIGCLMIIRNTPIEQKVISDQCSTAKSDILVYTIDEGPTGVYKAEGYVRTSNPKRVILQILEANFNDGYKVFGTHGILLAVMIIVSLSAVGILTGSIVVSVAMAMFGLLISVIIGFIYVSYPVLLGLIILSGLIMWWIKA